MKNISYPYFIPAAISMLIYFGCGFYNEITVTSDSGTDFSKYQTFAWVPDDADSANSPYNNEIIRNNIRNYFGRSFSARGYSVDLYKPDILLQLVVGNKKHEKEIVYHVYPRPYYYCSYYYCSDYYTPYSFDYYYRYYGDYCYPFGYCKEKIEYVEGSITLNVMDQKQNKLVWSGTAKGDIYDPAYINENIPPAVKAIMRKYPVKPMNESIKRNKKNSNSQEKPIAEKI